jgi:hypothetical protein
MSHLLHYVVREYVAGQYFTARNGFHTTLDAAKSHAADIVRTGNRTKVMRWTGTKWINLKMESVT